MEIAKRKDILERDWPHAVRHIFPCLLLLTLLFQRSDECAPAITINFVLLQSPLLSPHDPETIIVSREHRSINVSDNHLIIPRGSHFHFGTSGDSLELQPLQGPCTHISGTKPALLFDVLRG